MWNKVKTYFQVNLVDDVLADFKKVITKLENVSLFHAGQVKLHDEEAAFHAAAAAFSAKESDRAKVIAEKIKALLSA